MASTASSSQSALFLLCLLAPALAGAGDWKITPRVTFSEVFSDNPDLVSSSQADSDWITEISPGVSIRREGARLKVQADYRLTGLLYANDSSRNDIYHGLDGKAAAELVEDWFFLDATARISQQLKENASSGDTGVVGVGGVGGIGGGGQTGITGINNTSQVAGYSLRPYLKHRFGSYATVEAGVALEGTITDDSEVSDGTTTRYRLSAVSGNHYFPLSWNASYERSDTSNNNGQDDTSDDRASFNARYELTRKFGLLARASLEKNDFNGVDEDEEDYRSYGLGVFYTPSRRVSMDLYYNHSNSGDDDNFFSGSVTLKPTLRTAIKASSTQRSFGRSYGLNLNHRTRQSNWSLNYQEDLTTSQQQFLNYQGSVNVWSCPGGVEYKLPSEAPSDPATCTLIAIQNYFNQSQQDETYTSKILTGTVSYTHRRSTWALNVYNNRRQYESSGGDENTYGMQGSWNLRASPATTFTLAGGMSIEDQETGGDDDDLWNLGLAVTHQFDAKVSSNVGLRHQRRNSSQPGDSYKENSVAARLNMSF